jgi:hypothetical protein
MYNRIIVELTSFDEVRRAEASIELLCNKDLIFLKEATTDIGTALSENVNHFATYNLIADTRLYLFVQVVKEFILLHSRHKLIS